MVEFLRINHHVTAKIRDIISKADFFCHIISPFNDPDIGIAREFNHCKAPDFTIVCRPGCAKNLPASINIRYSENLHAKIYINEKECVISSMNLYSYSMENNIEIGMLISKKSDSEIYQQISEEVSKIIDEASVSDIFTSDYTKYKDLSIGLFAKKYNTTYEDIKKILISYGLIDEHENLTSEGEDFGGAIKTRRKDNLSIVTFPKDTIEIINAEKSEKEKSEKNEECLFYRKEYYNMRSECKRLRHRINKYEELKRNRLAKIAEKFLTCSIILAFILGGFTFISFSKAIIKLS